MQEVRRTSSRALNPQPSRFYRAGVLASLGAPVFSVRRPPVPRQGLGIDAPRKAAGKGIRRVWRVLDGDALGGETAVSSLVDWFAG